MLFVICTGNKETVSNGFVGTGYLVLQGSLGEAELLQNKIPGCFDCETGVQFTISIECLVIAFFVVLCSVAEAWEI